MALFGGSQSTQYIPVEERTDPEIAHILWGTLRSGLTLIYNIPLLWSRDLKQVLSEHELMPCAFTHPWLLSSTHQSIHRLLH